MGNQYETIIPSKLKYITLFSHQTNNSEVKRTMGFNASIYNNRIDHLWVDIAYLFVAKKVGIILDAKLAIIRGLYLFNEDYIIYRL